MANDGGTTAIIEQAMADVLAALQYNEADVFRTAEAWNYQIAVGQGGKEAFGKYAPFAFVRYEPPMNSDREGDGDLKQVLQFAICIGTESKQKGIARTGSSTVLGISKMRDLVIEALDDWHPGEGFSCDNFKYITDMVDTDTPTQYALVLFFQADLITI